MECPRRPVVLVMDQEEATMMMLKMAVRRGAPQTWWPE